ncbi:hypothetical protein BKA82DRAFT_24382 [Pisolithus tinctorius]|uniref:Uncharacterized protein n=1 Tax=Pisolithus tinctorius Marx 270 TaxID=870435 RepID=A0A0C3PEK7_PISTI|nr:hypothetical protein BKA82DRAFT_24382 [Pisolithus tinctorius]KIO06676.1 hypothetical protein M404DRAFT_24382 [Pisolithus tinctorius Marx 270]
MAIVASLPMLGEFAVADCEDKPPRSTRGALAVWRSIASSILIIRFWLLSFLRISSSFTSASSKMHLSYPTPIEPVKSTFDLNRNDKFHLVAPSRPRKRTQETKPCTPHIREDNVPYGLLGPQDFGNVRLFCAQNPESSS